MAPSFGEILSKSFKFPRRKTRLQILSDLHLEVGQQYARFDFPCVAPYLILAGDIGRLSTDYDSYLSFLCDRCCNRFQRVFLVLGNHEFYGGSHDEVVDTALLRLERESILGGRLVVLYRRRVDLPEEGVIILGCTLHSSIPQGATRDVVLKKVKDFERIKDWTVDDHNAEHHADVSWLKNEVEQIRREEKEGHQCRLKPRRIVVVTHYAPCLQGTSDRRHAHNLWNSAFATDLLPLDIPKSRSIGTTSTLSDVQWWVFGHTHFSTAFERSSVKLISNQRGYVRPGTPGTGPKEKTKSLSRLNFCLFIKWRISRWSANEVRGFHHDKVILV